MSRYPKFDRLLSMVEIIDEIRGQPNREQAYVAGLDRAGLTGSVLEETGGLHDAFMDFFDEVAAILAARDNPELTDLVAHDAVQIDDDADEAARRLHRASHNLSPRDRIIFAFALQAGLLDDEPAQRQEGDAA